MSHIVQAEIFIEVLSALVAEDRNRRAARALSQNKALAQRFMNGTASKGYPTGNSMSDKNAAPDASRQPGRP